MLTIAILYDEVVYHLFIYWVRWSRVLTVLTKSSESKLHRADFQDGESLTTCCGVRRKE